MTLEQYSDFVQLLPQIQAALKKDGATVPRPDYEGDAFTNDAEEEADEDEPGPSKKANIDATSDEDEGE